MAWHIKKQDIPLLAIGAKILSCGGGGDTRTVQTLLMSIMDNNDSITVKTISDLEEEWIAPVGIMGSTILYGENIPTGQEGIEALKVYESVSGKNAEALIALEIGGVNALTPLVTAFMAGLPVVDGDAMGRAFPELTMTTFYHADIPLTPFVMQTHQENMYIQGNHDIHETVEMAKEFMFRNGGFAHLLCLCADAKTIKTSMIPGSLKLCYRLGAVITGEQQNRKKIAQMKNVFENSVYGRPLQIIAGEVSKVTRWFEDGSLIGKLHVDGRGPYSSRSIELEFRNEFIAIKEDGYICTTPDLILVLDEDSLHPYNVSEIQSEHSVIVFAVPAPSILRTQAMLEYVGPGPFKLPDSYHPVSGGIDHEAGN
ncbi:DUF917 domain-containing protein [Peribacillus sp. SCS-155]|uniref:DUF917 domain-containing protein n=1 Tax=Peribacillus sedimenti TaxID=3115297 RepID=UPI003905E0E5